MDASMKLLKIYSSCLNYLPKLLKNTINNMAKCHSERSSSNSTAAKKERLMFIAEGVISQIRDLVKEVSDVLDDSSESEIVKESAYSRAVDILRNVDVASYSSR